MTFESFTIGTVTLLYFATAVNYGVKGNYPWCLIWFAYALANVGLIWAAKTTIKL